MANQYWEGDTSGDVSAGANWSGGTVPAANDFLMFDSAAVGDVTSGSIGINVHIAIGPQWNNSIGTPSSSVMLQDRFKTNQVAIYQLDGFVHANLYSNRVTIGEAPLGDQLILDGTMDDILVTASRGRITLKGSTDTNNLVVSPIPRSDGDRPTILIESGGDIDTIYLNGPCHVENNVSTSTVVLAHPGAEYIHKGQQLGGVSDTTVISGGRIVVEKDVFVSDGNHIISNGSYTVDPTTRTFAFGAAANIDLMKGGILNTEWAQNQSSGGTITSYGGRWSMRKPSTISLPSDTKISSTSGRSLDFSDAANSGHLPTVLW